MRFIPGEGPRDATTLLCGEAPGENEEKLLRPFIGKTGYELNNLYLPLAGLSRSEVYITNAYKYRPPANRTPTAKEVASHRHFLLEEAATIRPETVVLMGGTANSTRDRKWDLDTYHGFPRWERWCGVDTWVYPTYHPAYGLHEPRMMTRLMADFENLKYVLANPYDCLQTDKYGAVKSLDGFLEPGDLGWLWMSPEEDVIAIDTERQDGELWSIQFATDTSCGYAIDAANSDSVNKFRSRLDTFDIVVLQNAGQDLEALKQVDVRIPDYKVRDTMERAYLLGLPQGLKPMAYRLCGMEMRSYKELVGEWSRNAVMEWCAEAVMERTVKGKRQPKEVAVLNRIFRCLGNNDDYDAWEAWGKARGKDGEVDRAAEELPEMPREGIARVPLREAVRYGCEDAVATMRCWVEMEGMMGRRREEWGRGIRREDGTR
jgi:DNA polymerase